MMLQRIRTRSSRVGFDLTGEALSRKQRPKRDRFSLGRSCFSSGRASPRARGFALLIVLWTLGLLALLGTRLTATARVQLRLATEARDQAVAQAAADGGIRQAMFVAAAGGQVGSPGRPLRIRVGAAVVDIVGDSESGKINPNTVSRDVLRGLMVALGVDQPHANRLAGEIADWRVTNPVSVLGGQKIDQYRDRGLPYRPGDHAFYSVDELGLVADMTPEILDRLRPWLSVYHEGDLNDLAGGTPAAIAAGDASSTPGAAGSGFASQNVIVHVTATAVVPGGGRFVRSAVLRVRTGSDGSASTVHDMVQVLTWE
jgi:general secretion pathway protein K